MFAQPKVTEMINRLGDIEHPVPLGIEMLRRYRLSGRWPFGPAGPC